MAALNPTIIAYIVDMVTKHKKKQGKDVKITLVSQSQPCMGRHNPLSPTLGWRIKKYSVEQGIQSTIAHVL